VPGQCPGRNTTPGDEVAGCEAPWHLSLELLAGIAIGIGCNNKITDEQAATTPICQLQIPVMPEAFNSGQYQITDLRLEIAAEQRFCLRAIHPSCRK
jgi:hypothetical protein